MRRKAGCNEVDGGNLRRDVGKGVKPWERLSIPLPPGQNKGAVNGSREALRNCRIICLRCASWNCSCTNPTLGARAQAPKRACRHTCSQSRAHTHTHTHACTSLHAHTKHTTTHNNAHAHKYGHRYMRRHAHLPWTATVPGAMPGVNTSVASSTSRSGSCMAP